MVVEHDDDVSPIALALQWSSRITTAALCMALPAVGGYWLDQRWQTGWTFLIIGFVLGSAVGLSQLLHLLRDIKRRSGSSPTKKGRP